MPGKGRGAHRRCFKQTQLIQTRLIEISIKVEDVIYNKKPITEKEAKTYMKEVNSYRNACCSDERSLQVIDKLTRCMKAIIAEQKELKFNYDLTEDENSVESDCRSSASPVYSLPDEDKIQLSQNAQIFSDLNGFNNNSTSKIVTDNDNLQKETQLTQDIQGLQMISNEYKNSNEIMPLSHSSTEQYIITSSERNALSAIQNQDMELNKALSNLSITDTNLNDELMSIDLESSQSILNNIDPLQYFIPPEPQNLNDDQNLKFSTPTNNIMKDYVQASPKNNVPESSQRPANDNKNVTQCEIVKFDCPSSINDNNIDAERDINTTIEQPLNKENKRNHVLKLVTSNEANMILTKNKMKPNTNIQAIDKKLKIRDHIAQNLLKYTNGTQMSKNDIKSSGKKKAQASSSDNLTQLIQKIHNPANANTNICNEKSYPTEIAKNLNNSIMPTKEILEKCDKHNPSQSIKKKRGPRKNKKDGSITVKKERILINSSQKRNQIDDENNKTVEYQPKRKCMKNNNSPNNNIEKEIAIPIYNKNVTDDLSWLENIRFVREITKDEYEHHYLVSDSFWDNYDLPPNFDQNDFL